MKAFHIEGVDTEAGTVLVEIDRAILAPIVNALDEAIRPNGHNRTHVACRSLAAHLRNACHVLYGEAKPEDFGINVLDPVEDEEVAVVKTA